MTRPANVSNFSAVVHGICAQATAGSVDSVQDKLGALFCETIGTLYPYVQYDEADIDEVEPNPENRMQELLDELNTRYQLFDTDYDYILNGIQNEWTVHSQVFVYDNAAFKSHIERILTDAAEVERGENVDRMYGEMLERKTLYESISNKLHKYTTVWTKAQRTFELLAAGFVSFKRQGVDIETLYRNREGTTNDLLNVQTDLQSMKMYYEDYHRFYCNTPDCHMKRQGLEEFRMETYLIIVAAKRNFALLEAFVAKVLQDMTQIKIESGNAGTVDVIQKLQERLHGIKAQFPQAAELRTRVSASLINRKNAIIAARVSAAPLQGAAPERHIDSEGDSGSIASDSSSDDGSSHARCREELERALRDLAAARNAGDDPRRDYSAASILALKDYAVKDKAVARDNIDTGDPVNWRGAVWTAYGAMIADRNRDTLMDRVRHSERVNTPVLVQPIDSLYPQTQLFSGDVWAALAEMLNRSTEKTRVEFSVDGHIPPDTDTMQYIGVRRGRTEEPDQYVDYALVQQHRRVSCVWADTDYFDSPPCFPGWAPLGQSSVMTASVWLAAALKCVNDVTAKDDMRVRKYLALLLQQMPLQ